jgi:hypothetical protein
MPEVVELRVHGVGGTPPEGLLGVTGVTDLVRTGGDGDSAFFARLSDRSVEGYSWGPLTARGLLQPLWLFLLPLTLVNVAGWMLPRTRRARHKSMRWLARFLVLLLGMSLTVQYVYGFSIVIIREVFYQWRLGGRITGGRAALVLGAGVTLLVGLLFVVVARYTQRRFEMIHEPDRFRPEPGRVDNLKRRLFARDNNLGDPEIWARETRAFTLLIANSLVGLAALTWIVMSWWGAAARGGELEWRGIFLGLGGTQTVLLAALTLVCLLGFKDPIRFFILDHFRLLAPVVVSIVGIGLASGFFGSSAILLANILGVAPGVGTDLDVAFGAATLLFLLAAVFLGTYLWARSTVELRKIREQGNPRVNTAAPGREPDGVPVHRMKALARARSLSDFGANADWLLTAAAVGYSVGAIAAIVVDRLSTISIDMSIVGVLIVASLLVLLLARRHRIGFAEIALLLLALALAALRLRFQPNVTLGTLGQLGGWLALTATAAFLVTWVRGYFNPGQRRIAGILWDVLTFFPRRFHPFGVRPYAERAVPELTGRLRYHLEMERRIIFSAHSQGTVLAFAALLQLQDQATWLSERRAGLSVEDEKALRAKEHSWEVLRKSLAKLPDAAGKIRKFREDARRELGEKAALLHAGEVKADRIAFVTYGSPLGQLHGRFFPAYFHGRAFDELAALLFPGTVSIALENHPANWRNFYRLTDYIGKAVPLENGAEHNEQLADPPEQPQVSDLSFDVILEGPPDPFRSPWVDLSRHSHYNAEPSLKGWLTTLRRAF